MLGLGLAAPLFSYDISRGIQPCRRHVALLIVTITAIFLQENAPDRC